MFVTLSCCQMSLHIIFKVFQGYRSLTVALVCLLIIAFTLSVLQVKLTCVEH